MSRSSNTGTVSVYSPGVLEDFQNQNLALIRQKEQDANQQMALVQRREAEVASRERSLAFRENNIVTKEMSLRMQEDQFKAQQQVLADRESRVKNDEASVAEARITVERMKQYIEAMERERRSRRTNSEAYIEDTFPSLPPLDLVKLLAHDSDRIRRHAINTLKTNIDGSAARIHNHLQPPTLAPLLLAVLEPLLLSPKPDVLQFAVFSVQHPRLSLDYARAGECPRLLGFLRSTHEDIRKAALASLTRILKAGKASRGLLAPALLPYIKTLDPHTKSFVQESLPFITADLLGDFQYPQVVGLAFVEAECFREAVIPTLQAALRNPQGKAHRDGVVEADILNWFEKFLAESPVPSDIIDFFYASLPLLALSLSAGNNDRRLIAILWHPDDVISKTAVTTLKTIAMGPEDRKESLVKGDLLPSLQSKLVPLYSPPHILEFACFVIPALTVFFARNGECSRLIELLDHHHAPLRAATMAAIKRVLASGIDDRNYLRDAFLPLLRDQSPPAYLLLLVNMALPILTADLVDSNRFADVLNLIVHPNARVRALATPPILKAIHAQSQLRLNLVHSDFMSVLLRLCDSSNADSIDFASEVLPVMAVEFTRGGYTDQIIALLYHREEQIQGAARAAVLTVSKGIVTDQRALMNSHIEIVLLKILEESFPSDEVVDFSVRAIVNMALAFGGSIPHCSFLLGLLSSRHPRVRDSSTQALHVILRTDTATRRPLRDNLFTKLDEAAEPILELASSTIAQCLYGDFLLDGDFSAVFHTLFHVDSRVRAVAMSCLTAAIRNTQHLRVALCNAGFLKIMMQAYESHLLQQDVLTWCAGFALPELAIPLSETGHTAEIVLLLHHQELSIRTAGVSMLGDIANVSADQCAALVENGLFGELLQLLEPCEDLIVGFMGTILPKIVMPVTRVGDIEKVVKLLDHNNSQIRNASTVSLKVVLQTNPIERRPLRDIIVTKLLEARTQSFRDFASVALNDTICQDLVQDRDFYALFAFLSHSDPRIRQASVSELNSAISIFDSFRDDLCKAGFLSKLVLFLENPTPEIISLTATALPVLSLSLSRECEGSLVIRLLSHRRMEVRSAAASAIKSIVNASNDDREQLVAARFMHELTTYLREPDETLIDLTSVVLPPLGVFIAKHGEVEKLLALLSHQQDRVSLASLGALRLVMNSSHEYKSALVRGLISRLPSPPDTEVSFICEAVPVLAATFFDIGEGRVFLTLLSSNDDGIRIEADDAIRYLASRSTERHKTDLVVSGLLPLIVQLLGEKQLPEFAIPFATFVIPRLSFQSLENGVCGVLVLLFRFQIRELTRALDSSIRDLCNNPENYQTLVEADLIPELLRSLRAQPDPLVCELISFLCSKLADSTLASGKFRDVVDLLYHPEATLRCAGANALLKVASGTENSKHSLFNAAGFLSAVRESMETIYTTELCNVVTLLAFQSVIRSNSFLESGFSGPLIRLATDYSKKGSQIVALRALAALTGNMADCTPLVRADLLRSLASNITGQLSDINVLRLSLQIAENVAKVQAQRLPFNDSPLRVAVVKCLSHEDAAVLSSSLRICENLASESDAEVKTLIQDGILIVLVPLVEHHLAQIVILTSSVIQILAQSGTYRQAIIDSGSRKALKRVTSITHKSKMSSTENKKEAQRAADVALTVLGTRFDEILGRRPSSKGKNKGNMPGLAISGGHLQTLSESVVGESETSGGWIPRGVTQ